MKHGGRRKGSGRKKLHPARALSVKFSFRANSRQGLRYVRAAKRSGLLLRVWMREILDKAASA